MLHPVQLVYIMSTASENDQITSLEVQIDNFDSGTLKQFPLYQMSPESANTIHFAGAVSVEFCNSSQFNFSTYYPGIGINMDFH